MIDKLMLTLSRYILTKKLMTIMTVMLLVMNDAFQKENDASDRENLGEGKAPAFLQCVPSG